MRLLYSLLISLFVTTALFSYEVGDYYPPDCKKVDYIDIVVGTVIESGECTGIYADNVNDAIDNTLWRVLISHSEYYVESNNVCKSDYEILRLTNSYPTCEDGEILDTETCECIIPCDDEVPNGWIAYPMSNGSCKSYSALTELERGLYDEGQEGSMVCNSCYAPPATSCDLANCTLDCDSDGILNCVDSDDNNDGIADNLDPNHPDYNTTDTTCLGEDTTVSPTITGDAFSISSYRYLGEAYADDCVYYAMGNLNTWDGSLSYPDKNMNCLYVWCRVHEVQSSCTYSASERLASLGVGWTYNSSANTEDACTALVDGSTYDNHNWDVPNSLACPGTAFCFLHLVVDATEETNTENNDSTMDNDIDLNTTSADNEALLSAANTTNKHLTDLKDKADLTNTKLDSLTSINNNILASSKDVNNNLNNLNSKSDTLISNSNLMNSSLSSINRQLITSNSNTRALHSDLLTTNSQLAFVNSELDRITTNTDLINDKLQDGLFGDDPFAELDLTDDGSSKFGDFEGELSSSFGLTFESNIFGLANLTGGGLSSYTANFHGTTIVIFEPSMLNGLPIFEMRAFIMFIFTMMGFIHTFRTI